MVALLGCHAINSWNIVSNGEILILIAHVVWNRAILRASSGSSMRHMHAVAPCKHLVEVQIQVELMQRWVVLSGSASATSASSKSCWFISMTRSNICDVLRILHHTSLHKADVTLCDTVLLSQCDVS